MMDEKLIQQNYRPWYDQTGRPLKEEITRLERSREGWRCAALLFGVTLLVLLLGTVFKGDSVCKGLTQQECDELISDLPDDRELAHRRH
jgi:hypothetical protein